MGECTNHLVTFDPVMLIGPSRRRRIAAKCENEGCDEIVTLDQVLTKTAEALSNLYERVGAIEKALSPPTPGDDDGSTAPDSDT